VKCGKISIVTTVKDSMTPAGYLAKNVVTCPDWLKADHVVDVYSVSNCVSEDFADYINRWKHNGYWLFDSPEAIKEVAKEISVELENTRLFYYTVHDLEYDEDEKSWIPFEPEASFKTQVLEPEIKSLEGYDVVTFSAGTSPECSPLSCNSLASEIETNEHCLLPSFETAKELLEEGRFENSEPGPYRIFAVYSVQWP
jgi:hypothetical protein